MLHALKGMILNHLRVTWHDLQRWNSPNWKTRSFWFLLRWLTFPLVLPYYLYWVYRFHGQLNAKRQGAPVSGQKQRVSSK
jgi:hypothetical protein